MLELLQAIALLPTAILLAIAASQYVIIAARPKPKITGNYEPPVSIIVPAHNEGKYIGNTVKALLSEEYGSKKEIIVVDDGSTDNTSDVLKTFRKPGITIFKTNHIGKSGALNAALKRARNDIVVVIDGDSEIEPGSLRNLVRPLADDKVAAVAGILKVKNHTTPITWFQRIEYLYSSFFGSLCDRINGNMFAPGPISAFRKSAVSTGFSTEVCLEDVDMALRIIGRGLRIRVAEDAVVRTNVPETLGSWSRQRRRWMRGGIQAIQNHGKIAFRKRFGSAGFYSLPILAYWYLNSLVMGIVIFGQVVLGYYAWYYLNGAGFSLAALQYFFSWFSMLGIINLAYMMITGALAPTPLLVMVVAMSALNYPLYVYPFIRYREKFGLKDAFALFFMFPYWTMVLILQAVSNAGWLRKRGGRNLWNK